ncbi:hypothetical protein SAMN06298226_0288 [Nitrosovibrio sp. Nv4]|nr:hypothetical protein SAMN06298226_0288 [Nitrosovibrio sp. Nv4]
MVIRVSRPLSYVCQVVQAVGYEVVLFYLLYATLRSSSFFYSWECQELTLTRFGFIPAAN